MPFSTNSVTAALSGLITNAAETNPFTFTTTKTTVANYNQTEPRDARSCLGGVQGSILDVFGGGDYEFDMFNVKLWQNRGQDRGFQIRYGKNLTDIKQEESIEDTITGIVPFYKNESTTITLPEKVISTASASNFPYPRTIPVDLSSEFQDSVPTVTQLRNAGNAYIASHSIGVPKVSLDVSFVNLADMVGYEDIAILEDVRLCDTVTVIFEKLGVSASAKVISTEWDVLKDKFNKVGLGSTSNSLASKIANIEKVQTESSSFLEDAIQRATNLITGESGGYVVIHNNSEGKPYEILIMDNEDIDQAVHVWRWNKSGWGYSSTGYNGTYSLAATIDGGIVADFIKAGTIQGIAYNNGSGTFQVDSSGNLRATSAYISGDIVGSDITGSTFHAENSNGDYVDIRNQLVITNHEEEVHGAYGTDQIQTFAGIGDGHIYVQQKTIDGRGDTHQESMDIGADYVHMFSKGGSYVPLTIDLEDLLDSIEVSIGSNDIDGQLNVFGNVNVGNSSQPGTINLVGSELISHSLSVGDDSHATPDNLNVFGNVNVGNASHNRNVYITGHLYVNGVLIA
jgi:phage minor structural protein